MRNGVKRFGISIEEELLEELDRFTEEKKFPSRSQAIRHLIQKNKISEKWENNEEVAGAIVLIFDHGRRELEAQSTNVQHHHHDLILSVQHIHLNHDTCLETIAVKGRARDLRELANSLISIKGVRHGELVMSAVK